MVPEESRETTLDTGSSPSESCSNAPESRSNAPESRSNDSRILFQCDQNLHVDDRFIVLASDLPLLGTKCGCFDALNSHKQT